MSVPRSPRASATGHRALVLTILAALVLAPTAALPAAGVARVPAGIRADIAVPEARVVQAPNEPLTIAGQPCVGESLSVVPGSWQPHDVALSYEWFADSSVLDGRSGQTLEIGPDLVGTSLSARVTGTVPDPGAQPTTVTTVATSVVERCAVQGAAPAIVGLAVVGERLRASVTWLPVGSLSYQWSRDGAPIVGADASEYVVTSADLGAAIVVTVTSRESSHLPRTESSAPTAAVTGVLSGAVPTIVGSARIGSTLTAGPGAWSNGATLSYRWTRDGAAVAGATRPTYVPAPADLGHEIGVIVTGSAAFHPDAERTSPTVTVGAGALSAATPKISGTAQVGKKLTASVGTWTPKPSVSYQWRANGTAIKGATHSTYTVPSSLHGKKITLTVTGKAVGYTTRSVTSAATQAVAAGTFSAPTPKITGTARVGSTLRVTAGSWAPKGAVSYRWKAGGKSISGATKSTYVLKKNDHAKRITVTVTGRATGYATRSVTSSSTVAVATKFARTAAPKISGTVQVGKTLKASPGSWSPTPLFSYQWKVDGRSVSGATRSTFKVRSGDKGKRITVTVTGKRSTYVTAYRASAKTAAVKAAPRPSRTSPASTWNCPSWARVKGNASSMIYHVPGGRWYDRTKPEECFTTTGAARAAGYRPSKNG
ncbi:hypothetical protein [Cellulosimicrobium arenosum]|uniref:Ig-like domain-containing protein n=1 Tax=Cellulosimicrobium arenosum TaxID=2708133 RepID=A0A927J2K7_9MICO|nr:hypothetical protein [Cellulosimicrobium arenosum]MBD8080738.1 hypothetical protein [Cellulosimicrobium arenosum]